MEFDLKTTKVNEFINITLEIDEAIEESGVSDGICVVFIPHTTAGITLAEGVDPDVTRDVVMALERQFPWEDGYIHVKWGKAANAKSSSVGVSETMIIKNGKKYTGSWQQAFFCEFSGPGRRKVYVKTIDNPDKTFLGKISLQTSGQTDFVDIMAQVEENIRESGIKDGICVLHLPETSAGITINDSENDVPRVLADEMGKMIPTKTNYSAQVKTSIMGNTETVIIENGSLLLGDRQRIMCFEFDGPRKREIFLRIIGNE